MAKAIQLRKNAQKTAIKVKSRLKALKKKTLDEISQKMFDAKKENNNKLPHNFVPSIVKEMKDLCPWINRNCINYHYSVWDKKQKEGALVLQSNSYLKPKGGRPKGTTDGDKKLYTDNLKAAKNEIAPIAL